LLLWVRAAVWMSREQMTTESRLLSDSTNLRLMMPRQRKIRNKRILMSRKPAVSLDIGMGT
jgi:hypothetical protein